MHDHGIRDIFYVFLYTYVRQKLFGGLLKTSVNKARCTESDIMHASRITETHIYGIHLFLQIVWLFINTITLHTSRSEGGYKLLHNDLTWQWCIEIESLHQFVLLIWAIITNPRKYVLAG